MASAEKTNPGLWERVKDELMQSDKGGEPGQWSARKAQLAVQEYKKRGGDYTDDGPDQEDTDLHAWTEEDWGTKSGGTSTNDGERYLPRQVRMILTEDEYARSTQRKREGETQFVDQPEDVREKVSRMKKNGPTKKMLSQRARDLDIDGRSSMDKGELLDAIEHVTDENGRGLGSVASLQRKTKQELYGIAQDQGIKGRSSMTKDELVNAIADD